MAVASTPSLEKETRKRSNTQPSRGEEYKPVYDICSVFDLPFDDVQAGRPFECPTCRKRKLKFSIPESGRGGCDGCHTTWANWDDFAQKTKGLGWAQSCAITRVADRSRANGTATSAIPSITNRRPSASGTAEKKSTPPRLEHRLTNLKPANLMRLQLWCQTHKPGVTAEALLAHGAVEGEFRQFEKTKSPQKVIAIPAWDAATLTRIVNYQIYGLQRPLEVRREIKGKWTTVHEKVYTVFATESKSDGIILSNEARTAIIRGEAIMDLSAIKAEGPSDCLAMWRLSNMADFPVIAFTNAFGARVGRKSALIITSFATALSKLGPKRCLVIHDCDKDGQNGAIIADPEIDNGRTIAGWANFLAVICPNTFNVTLQEEIADEKGFDFRDWVLFERDGEKHMRTWAELEEVIAARSTLAKPIDLGATAELASDEQEPLAGEGESSDSPPERDPDEHPDSESLYDLPKLPVTNFLVKVIVEGEGKDAKEVRIQQAIPIYTIVQEILRRNNGWPKVCNNPFVCDPDTQDVRTVDSVDRFFAWLRMHETVRWANAAALPTKGELFAGLRSCCESYVSIQRCPHFPPVPNVYYTCGNPSPGDGERLDELVSYFSPESDHDRELILAAFVTPAWGGPPGQRPGFMITSAHGQGAGKTTLVSKIGQLYGGVTEFSMKGDHDTDRKRLINDPKQNRVILVDNVKATVFASSSLEALVTANEISGHQLFTGEASRPNFMTCFVTMNSVSLGRDLAQRFVTVMLGKRKPIKNWTYEVNSLIDSHRNEIFADIAAFFERTPTGFDFDTRWGAWSEAVLSRLQFPGMVAQQIIDREQFNDSDWQLAIELEERICSKLEDRGFTENKMGAFRVHLPSRFIQRCIEAVLDETMSAKKATGIVNRLIESDIIKTIQPNPSRATMGRGYVLSSETANDEAIDYSFAKSYLEINPA